MDNISVWREEQKDIVGAAINHYGVLLRMFSNSRGDVTIDDKLVIPKYAIDNFREEWRAFFEEYDKVWSEK